MKTFGSLFHASVFCMLMVLFVQAWMFRMIEAQKVPAVFFFGDSYCDTGNNDYISAGLKANFAPYGRDFIGHVPTGRFSNGKLMPDNFVEGLGIKDLLPAYLDPNLQDSDLITGVNFASAGSGLDNLTNNITNAIPFWKQVDYFKEYTIRLVGLVGEERAAIILNKAIYFILIGSNDFVNNYYLFPFRSSHLTVSQYTDFLLQIYLSYIKELYNLKAHRIGLINVPPLGCLPGTKTLRNYSQIKGNCVDEVNQAASGFNTGLNAIIDELKSGVPELKIVSLDYYGLVLDLIENPGKWGTPCPITSHIDFLCLDVMCVSTVTSNSLMFVCMAGIEVTAEACCVTGNMELALLCNRLTPITCLDPDKYIFFDMAHFTQRVYDIISHIFLSREILQLL